MCPGGCGLFQGQESAERVSCKGIWEEKGRSCGGSVPSGKAPSTALPSPHGLCGFPRSLQKQRPCQGPRELLKKVGRSWRAGLRPGSSDGRRAGPSGRGGSWGAPAEGGGGTFRAKQDEVAAWRQPNPGKPNPHTWKLRVLGGVGAGSPGESPL